MEIYCHRHPDRIAVAILNGKYPICDDCVVDTSAYILNAGGMVGLAVKGEPKALLIPQKGKNN